MTPRGELCFAALLGVFLAASPLRGEPIQCPESIKESPTVSSNDTAWTVVSKTGDRPLEHVGIYLGTVSEMGAQVPDSTKKVGTREMIAWTLPRQTADAFWVGCSYFGTTAMLYRELDRNVKRCVATYDLLPSGKRQRVRALECQ